MDTSQWAPNEQDSWYMAFGGGVSQDVAEWEFWIQTVLALLQC